MENKSHIGKKIGIIIDSLYGGGAEKIASLLSEYFSQKGHEVYLLIDMHYANQSYPFRGKVRHLSVVKTGNPWIDVYYKAQALKKMKQELQLDCALSFMEEYNFINIISRCNEKVYISERTYLSGRMKEWCRKEKFYRTLVPWLYRKADGIIVQTHEQQIDLCKNFKVKNSNMVVIPNHINKRKSNNDSIVEMRHPAIIMEGRLVSVKAQWHMIKAMVDVLRKIPDAQLYMLGQGDRRDDLMELAKKLHVDRNIHFEGFTSDVMSYLQGADIFVMTSHAEGFPNAILDALSAGLPVVSSDCLSGPRDILAPDTERLDNAAIEWAEYGVLIPRLESDYSDVIDESEHLLGQAIVQLLQDRHMQAHYRKQAKARCSAYTQDLICQLWEKQIIG